MTPTLYGIDTCDQCRKARQWLRARGVAVNWHDLRADGVTEALIARWLARVPWDALLNRRGQTWRQLPEAQRRAIVDAASLSEALLASPLLIKRPVLEADDRLLIGFSEQSYDAAFPR
ncbi:MAG: arsenate reductase [Betaproteobacteria bacterium]|nr:arsenate reductase [Betaproteobacteria bacterium]